MYSNLPSLYLKLLVHEITAPCGPFSGLIQTYSYNFLVFKKKIKNKIKTTNLSWRGEPKKKTMTNLELSGRATHKVGGPKF